MHKNLLINILMRLRHVFEWRKDTPQIKKTPNNNRKKLLTFMREYSSGLKSYLKGGHNLSKLDNLFLLGTAVGKN